MKDLYISVDVETSGPSPGRFSLLSLGACLVHQPDKKFYMELKPISEHFDPAALKVTGLTFDHFLTNGIDPSKGMAQFSYWLSTIIEDNDPIFVGFNAPFDWSFVNWYFHEYAGENPFGIGGLDIKAYFMGMRGCSWSETKSSQIPAQFKGTSHHTHNALDDAIEQAEMFALMLNSNSARRDCV
jgi:ribonuclease T